METSEDPLRTNVLRPGRLTMRECACFYCGSENHHDFSIERLFGIRHCADHKEWAIRDCRALCHELGKIPTYWLKDDIRFQMLWLALASNVRVRRSNGSIDADWKVAYGSYFNPLYITKLEEGWAIPMESSQDPRKVVLVDTLRELNPNINPTVFATIVALLDSGIYKAEYDEHVRVSLVGESTALPEDSRVQTLVYNDEEVRVFHG